MQLFRILRRKPSRMEIGTDFLQGRRSPVVSGKQLVRNLSTLEASRTMDFFIFSNAKRRLEVIFSNEHTVG